MYLNECHWTLYLPILLVITPLGAQHPIRRLYVILAFLTLNKTVLSHGVIIIIHYQNNITWVGTWRCLSDKPHSKFIWTYGSYSYHRLGRRGEILVSATKMRSATVPRAVDVCSAVPWVRLDDTSWEITLTPLKPGVCKDMACWELFML